MPMTKGAAPDGDPRQMPGLHGTDRIAGTAARGDGSVLRGTEGLPPARPADSGAPGSGAAGSGTLAPGSLMTSPPEHAPARSRPPNAAGRRVATDAVTEWALASRDREREAFRALAFAAPPPAIRRQEATA